MFTRRESRQDFMQKRKEIDLLAQVYIAGA